MSVLWQENQADFAEKSIKERMEKMNEPSTIKHVLLALFEKIEKVLDPKLQTRVVLTELMNATAGLDELAKKIPTCRAADYHLYMLIKQLRGLIRAFEFGSKNDSDTADYYRRNIRARIEQLKIQIAEDTSLQKFLLELAA